MLQNQSILPPPWIALPAVERGSMHWRMGEGEWYLCEKWLPWYRTLSEEDKAEYQRLFPEPVMWKGFLTQEPECSFLHVGSLSVDLWREKGQPKYSRELLCKAFDAGETLDFLMFWRNHARYPGSTDKSCLSQWWISPFVYHGEPYCCMEQCMMAGKAKAFQDEATLEKIMNADDPKKIKALGRQVHPFDSAEWDRIKYPLILNGNYQKFSQDPQLRTFLLSTGDSILVEASPYDGVWGIALPAEDAESRDPHRWQGENLLGFALMEVRDEIRRVYACADLCREPF